MKKALWLALLVVAVLAVVAVPAMAGGDNQRHRWQGTRFGLVGEVTAVDAGARTITVLVHTGSWLVKNYIGEELMVTTDAGTRFLRFSDPKCEFIAFEDVEEDAYVSVNGIFLADEGGDVFLAKRVTVDVPHRAQQ
jgi:hypothetical protein